MKNKGATTDLYTPGYSDAKTYLLAALFVIGNVAVPQLCHLAALGGPRWLPIYFFTLIAGYKYGWKTGLLTALASAAINHGLFGMPSTAALPAILVKSSALALIAGIVSRKFGRVSVTGIALTVAGYQTVGTLAEWAMSGSASTALQDVAIGYPGLMVQTLGGYLLLRALSR